MFLKQSGERPLLKAMLSIGVNDLKSQSHGEVGMEDTATISQDEAIAALLARNPAQPRDEPEVAANIGVQLKHMELQSPSLSIRRRIRDICARLQPTGVIEVGAGIGHLSSWLLDLWQREDERPSSYELVEAGPKFGVILKRLLQRYSKVTGARVVVGKFEQLAAEATAWNAASSSISTQSAEASLGEAPLHLPADLVIVDVGESGLSNCIRAALPLLSNDGWLLTIEPEVPAEDETDQDKIEAFQEWIDLVKDVSQNRRMAFQPLTGGTIVAIGN